MAGRLKLAGSGIVGRWRLVPLAVESSLGPCVANAGDDVGHGWKKRSSTSGFTIIELLVVMSLIVILATSFALIAVVSALDTQHRRWHVALTVGMSLLIALNLTLVIALDRPFAGAAAVSDTPYREGVPPAALVCDG